MPFTNKQYILVLPSWYPSEAHKYNGDFNQRLVDAVSLNVSQIVLFVVGRSNITKTYFTILEENNLKTYLVYFPIRKRIFGKFYSKFNYAILYIKFLKLIFAENGLPKLTQVYVFWTAGLIALLLKKIYSIPYLITEHWTAFYKDSPSDLYKHNFLKRVLFKIILKGTNDFIAVAEKLKIRILEWNPKAIITVIPNVVDTSIFNSQYERVITDKFKLIHVSSMKIQKNILGLLEGYEEALINNPNLELVLVGEISNEVNFKIDSSIYLKNNIICTGEIEYSFVKDFMEQSDALIMFSRYENLPCVILEALCCGLPVITSDVGGCAEVINESNGIIVQNENVDQLTQSIQYLFENKSNFNTELISRNAIKNFSYNSVSSKILKVYESIV